MSTGTLNSSLVLVRAARPCWLGPSSSLTTVVLISLVPAVVHTIAVKELGQALTDVPTGEGAKGTADILCTSKGDWGKVERNRTVGKGTSAPKVGPVTAPTHLSPGLVSGETWHCHHQGHSCFPEPLPHQGAHHSIFSWGFLTNPYFFVYCFILP